MLCSERPVLINGLIDNTAYPSLSLNSPSSPSSMPWLPAVSYAPYRSNLLTSPRSGLSLGDSSSGALSDVASGGSPPISPGPLKMPGGIVGKGVPGDSSEGSEDMDRGGLASSTGCCRVVFIFWVFMLPVTEVGGGEYDGILVCVCVPMTPSFFFSFFSSSC